MLLRIVATLVVAFMCAEAASAEKSGTSQTTFPGWAPTDAMVRIQEKAESAFEAGKYRKAFWLYSKELAPVGDKYGQYMVGYMHENGLSVPRDLVQAGAWYLLAAERGHEPIVAAAQTLQRSMGPEQLAAAKAQAASLKQRWGDKALVRQAIRRDMKRLKSVSGIRVRPGSRRNCGGQPGRILVGMRSITFDEYCEAVIDRIEQRVAYLEGYVTYGELELLPDEDDDTAASSTEGEAEQGVRPR